MTHSVKLRLDGVSKSFAKVEKDDITNALTNVSLEMQSGEFVTLVGPSGCGKSTILRLVAGLIQPTIGTVTVNGEDIKSPGPERGMVFQQPTLFPWMTVKKNIAFSLKMQGKLKGNEAAITRMLKLIDLEDFKDDYPNQLSGGMAQRVALVRSLISEPEILLLDEPLGALDAFTRMNMQDEILSMWEDQRQLLIMVTHDIDEAVYMGSRVVVMDKNPGRISAQISIDMPHPRNRSSAQFVLYRNQILKMLHYGGEDKQLPE